MATAKEESWQIKKRAEACTGTGLPFGDGEEIITRLLLENGEYVREDYSIACWEEQNLDPGISSWKSIFHKPAPPEEAVKKESAESLLRKLVAKEDPDNINAIYILAVMLERKKILVEKEVQIREDKTKVRIYEHKKSGDTFLIVDPELKLADIGAVQEEVVGLLGGKPPKTETVYQFEALVDLLIQKYKTILFPRRPLGGEEGIVQKLAACFIAELGTKKNPYRAEADKILARFEDADPWGSIVKDYFDLIDRIPQEVRFRGMEKPEFAKKIAELCRKEARAIELSEIRELFAADDPRVAELREKVEAAVHTATRYADTP